VFCTNCGTKIDPGERFCSNCGASIVKTSPGKKGISSKAMSIMIPIVIVIIMGGIFAAVFLLKGVPSDSVVVNGNTNKNEENKVIEENENGIESPVDNDENEITELSSEESINFKQEQKQPWEYLIGDYIGVQVREKDSTIFLKRINIVDDWENIRIDCYSQEKGVLEDKPNGIVYISKDNIRIVDNEINIYSEYMVSYRPGERKIGYFDMHLTLGLDIPDVLTGVNYYTEDFLNGRTSEHVYMLELKKS